MEKVQFRAFRQNVRELVRGTLVAAEVELEEKKSIPVSIIGQMKSMGLYSLIIPTEYGGMGLPLTDELELVEELGWTSPSFYTALGGNIGIGAEGIVSRGNANQKDALLPLLASGELTAAFAMTEPNAGSDAGSMQMVATPCEGGFRLSGTKTWVTNAATAGIFTVFARTGTVEERSRGITAFLVDALSDGIHIGDDLPLLGQPAIRVSHVSFDGCFVPSDRVLGGMGEGLNIGLELLSRGRLRVSALCLGHARRLLNDCVLRAKGRRQFGAAISDYQLIQQKIADMFVRIHALEGMLKLSAPLSGEGKSFATASSATKLYASEMVQSVAADAMQIFGGEGHSLHNSPARFYRDVRLYTIYEGTSEMQRLTIAKNVLRDAE